MAFTVYIFFSLDEYFSKVFQIKEFQLILLAAMEWKSVWLVPPNQWNIPRETLFRSCISKSLSKLNRKIKVKSQKFGSPERCFLKTYVLTGFFMSSRLQLFLFLLLGRREKSFCFCHWLYGRCPYVQCIGTSSADGAFSHRWCPIFNLALCYHRIIES